jgi:hypothetical protein
MYTLNVTWINNRRYLSYTFRELEAQSNTTLAFIGPEFYGNKTTPVEIPLELQQKERIQKQYWNSFGILDHFQAVLTTKLDLPLCQSSPISDCHYHTWPNGTKQELALGSCRLPIDSPNSAGTQSSIVRRLAGSFYC